MVHFLRQHALRALATAVFIALVSFLALNVRPEETARRLIASGAEVAGNQNDAQALARVMHARGLDRSLAARFSSWAQGLVVGDFGTSWTYPGRSVRDLLVDRVPYTIALTTTGLLLQLLLGVLLAGAALRRRDSWQDAAISAGSVGLYALPEFCLGLLLVWPLGVHLGWLPVSGASSTPGIPGAGLSLADFAAHLVLPATCLGLGGAGAVARLVRTRWEEELDKRYALAARARGAGAARVLWVHTFRAASGPLWTAVGLSLPRLVGGAVVVETLFNWPGVGKLLVDAASQGDLQLIAGANLIVAVLVAGGGLLAELLLGAADPRARTS